VLRPVYDRFTEGFDTFDLRSAKCLLDELRSDHLVVSDEIQPVRAG
jgi:hypothetical protein